VEFGTLMSRTAARLEKNVYVGPNCNLGWVHIGRDTLLASSVVIPSGPNTHGIDDPNRPIREQPGSLREVRIGEGCWIGSHAVVLADIGDGTVVAAGSVVTTELPAGVIAGGVPAKVLRGRTPADAGTDAETNPGSAS
jgi:acetyltransferase-like isoleucine patch superfamily enzyme